MGNYIELRDLEVYKLARELSRLAWKVYEDLEWQDKKVMGDQFVTATDSVGANIAEGYGRYHYLDKVKFYYNARASLVEAGEHWIELLHERKLAPDKVYEDFKKAARLLAVKLNNFIAATCRAKEEKKD